MSALIKPIHEYEEEQDMSRLSMDALVLLARIGAGEMMTIEAIAINVFNGGTLIQGQIKATAVSLARATRAAVNLCIMERAEPIPNRKHISAIRSLDKSGAVQAQFAMNLMVRGGAERRKGDRRSEERTESVERRADETTVVIPPATFTPEEVVEEPKIVVVPPQRWRRTRIG